MSSLTPDSGNAVGVLQQTLSDAIKAEKLVKRVAGVRGQAVPFMRLDELADEALARAEINSDEAALLRRFEQGRLRAINVDDFEPAALAAGAAPAYQGQTPDMQR